MRDKIRFTLSALTWAVVLLAAYALAAHAQTSAGHDQRAAKKGGAVQPAGVSLSADGTGTAGHLSKWTGSTTLGDSAISETKSGQVGIGTSSPTSKLTVQGVIETASGGFKFPDGTIQTTAASGGSVAAVPLLLMLLFYPITLSKFAFFSTVWVIVMLVLSRFFEPRIATVLSILLPMLLGVILVSAYLNDYTQYYFGVVNIRMMATPSSAMDIYNDFFSSHPRTWFCQISFLKPLMSCPYQEQLSVVMEEFYQLGKFNASLFATEGIASVGLYFAPLTALVCGLVIAIGNRVSAELPPRFVLISGVLLPPAFINVPFTTALLTHGTVILFLLWYIMPRTMFQPGRTGGFPDQAQAEHAVETLHPTPQGDQQA